MQPGALPDTDALGRALAANNDWRALMIIMVVVLAMQFGFIVWRETSLIGLRKSIDRVSDALWQLRLTLIEERQARSKGSNDEI